MDQALLQLCFGYGPWAKAALSLLPSWIVESRSRVMDSFRVEYEAVNGAINGSSSDSEWQAFYQFIIDSLPERFVYSKGLRE